MKIKYLFIAIISTGLLFQACKNNEKKEVKKEQIAAIDTKDDIVTIAVENDNFSTLVEAVKAADLVETLKGDGPFTVFAPVNNAFEKLPEGTVASLLKKENKQKLSNVLTYHVVSGKYTATDVVAAIKNNNGAFSIPTVQGGTITASINADGKVILTDEKGVTSTVILTDVEASNGIIHAIDAVVMPK